MLTLERTRISCRAGLPELPIRGLTGNLRPQGPTPFDTGVAGPPFMLCRQLPTLPSGSMMRVVSTVFTSGGDAAWGKIQRTRLL
jgi:hypothetical protein